MSLDFPTLTVLGFLLCIGIAVGFSLLLVVLRGQPVLRLWTASLWLLTLGVTLLALRPYLPLAPAILAGNAAMAGCALLMLRGVALHLEQPLPLWRPLLMAAVFMACIFAFLVLWPDLGVRLQVFSVFTLLVDGWIAWLLLRHAPVQQRTSCRLAAVVFLAEAALYAVRLFLPVAPDAGEDIMRTGTPMFVTYIAGVMLELARCFAMVLLLVERMLVDLRRAARTDGLTGLLNRSAVLADGQVQLQRLRRQGRPLALLLIDVDHFKQINDRWGHLAGDEVLRHFAAVLQHGLQGRDTLLGRYGGEEFVLVLAGSTQAEAMARAATIRTALQQNPARLATGPVTFTASIGLAMDDGQGELSTLLAAADAALYRAKAAGRDRLACATPAEISRLPIADDAVPV
ncbi:MULTISPECIES: GGDEF domain-containing protein [Stenotrophomonas]|uniref:GGDEF domain-containing protein n=1 Tax=Stenotrophomonas TaxID=40323 RepID=UPI00066D5DC0|nr:MULTISPECIES: GGDEF domain-containing protein [Stenotrophomonas]ELC7365958.1 GGDEF domain-containing protein [Stenotrophomonas maltophilia]ELF4108332.1 GGDEF domain-containing protein [Stenotrophomonas maltophilia]MBA0253737.1 GGDEF domain-containing protein [Stenotrophomonas maltophilia]MBA0321853.1 GGDEF domain-containing protein [Stenotrophomonas maltophilia]MBH1631968.1 GGDEF domain-containing protein [Stenotrophomonas maltophilia]